MLSSLSNLIVWTLIHSFWIAAAALILTKIGTLATNKARIKGIIRLLSLFLFLIVIGILFLWKIDLEPASGYGIVLTNDSGFEVFEVGWFMKIESWIASNSQFLSLCWMLGSILSLIRYYAGFYQIQRVKQFSHHCTHEQILATTKRIGKQLRIRSKVEVRISSLINSPFTFGWIKPIIYLPIGLTTGFSSAEIDTIIYHEMVHVKRQDYLVNLILASIETIFFFNPFILIIIKELRSDMEYACDDLVVKHNSKGTYVHALLKLQELKLSASLALAAKGSNSEFLKRINKMMNKTNNSNEKSKLLPGLIICLLLATSIIGSAFISKAEPSIETVRTEVIQERDTIRVATREELRQKLAGFDVKKIPTTVFLVNGKVMPVISSDSFSKGERMMEHIKKELIKDGLLSEGNKRIRLMFQYSDLLNGKEVLGDKYPKYKEIFNDYFPKYDSYATTKVFKFDN